MEVDPTILQAGATDGNAEKSVPVIKFNWGNDEPIEIVAILTGWRSAVYIAGGLGRAQESAEDIHWTRWIWLLKGVPRCNTSLYAGRLWQIYWDTSGGWWRPQALETITAKRTCGWARTNLQRCLSWYLATKPTNGRLRVFLRARLCGKTDNRWLLAGPSSMSLFRTIQQIHYYWILSL